ncbi:universal stress protein [Streptomyces sp. B93]|uniref:universal stress protein n=1 Tax=Streptomyces sp. B93 TaxID=2824875 RepID=UPI001B375967|nr:universal stress protein [Streptomyces sp. B93]MBQ1093436.1 universal stress protein [Streptomyces sp. B93]
MDFPLVVGVDGSEPSLRAVDWAADEAARRGVPLRVVYASLWERYEGPAPGYHASHVRPRGDDVVEVAGRRASDRQPDLKVTVEVVSEEPEYALVREGRQATAVVVGTRGHGGFAGALLGSVSVTVAANAHCPVIVVRGGDATPTGGRIVVGVGEGAETAATVRYAVEAARLRGAPLEAVRAWRRPVRDTTGNPLRAGGPAGPAYEEEAALTLDEALRDTGDDVRVIRRTVEGHARRALVDASHDAALVVVGARRRGGRFGLQLGRVAHAVLHHAACPVVVVPQRVA